MCVYGAVYGMGVLVCVLCVWYGVCDAVCMGLYDCVYDAVCMV